MTFMLKKAKLSKLGDRKFISVTMTAVCILLVFFMLEKQASLAASLQVILISILVLFLPGYWLTHLIWLRRLTLSERITLSFGLSIGLWCIPSVLLVWLHSNLNIMFGIVITVTALIVGAGLFFWFVRSQSQISTKQISPASSYSQICRVDVDWIRLIYFLSFLGTVTLVIITFIDVISPYRGDRLTYQAFTRHFLTADQFFGNGFRISNEFVIQNTRELIQPWLVIMALIIKLANVDLLDTYVYYIPILLIPISFLALYELAKELFEDEIIAITACMVQTVYYFSDILAKQEGIGYSLFLRIIEDKFLVRFVLLPIALWLTLRYLKSRNKRELIALSIVIVATGLVHSIGIALYGISVGTFFLVNLFLSPWREIKEKFVIYIPIVGAILITSLIPLWQVRQSSTVETDLRRNESAATITFDLQSGLDNSPLGQLRAERLFIISKEDGQFISSPNLIAHPLVILAILLTPLLIKYLHQNLGAQFLFANMTGGLFLCYTPFITPALGRVITPWMIWRVLWILPVTLVITFFLDEMIRKLKSRLKWSSPLLQLAPLCIIVLTVPLLWKNIVQGLVDLSEIKSRALTSEERDVLTYLRYYGEAQSYILTPAFQLNDEIPGLVGHSYGMTFRSSPPRFESAPEDQKLFYNTPLLTQTHLDILRQYDIDYVIVENKTALSRQINRFSGMFENLYANKHYTLYHWHASKATESEKEVIKGNTFFLKNNQSAAQTAYRQALQQEPSFVPALISLGRLYIHQGNPTKAIRFYQQAIDITPHDPYLRLSLAEAYLAQGETTGNPTAYRKATATYQQALRLAPDDSEIREKLVAAYLTLGDLYFEQDLQSEVIAAYQKVIELKPDEVQVYWQLAEVYETLGNLDKATEVYSNVVERWPNLAEAHLRLGQAYETQEKIDQAIVEYQQAIELEPTLAEAYTRLGGLYRTQDRLDEAITLYRTASKNSAEAAWPHVRLGQLYLEQAKLQ